LGAGTGRHASRSPNLQNLQREDGDTLAKVKAVLSGDLTEVAKFGPALQVLSSIERALICAELGKRFCLADWSGQESRGLAYIAAEQWKCEAWDKADRTGKPEDQPYYLLGIKCGMRSDIARAFGKALDLACGYGSGPDRVRQQILKSFPELADADFERFVNIWRTEHPVTCRFWKRLQQVAVTAIQRPNIEWTCGELALWFDGMFLKIRLPSQRCISFARLGTGKYGDAVVIFKDAQQGRFEDCNHGYGFWGGALVENVVQGLGRDILMDAVVRLEEAHYDVVLTIHDEVICEVAEDFGSLEEFQALVAQRPTWAPDLPLAVKARIGPRLANIDLPVTASVPGTLNTVPCYAMTQRAEGALFAPKRSLILPDPATIPAWDMPVLSEIHHSSDNMLGRWIAFIVAREQARLNRAAGLPREQWTDHPLIRKYKFTTLSDPTTVPQNGTMSIGSSRTTTILMCGSPRSLQCW
jgi:hypothetical protein